MQDDQEGEPTLRLAGFWRRLLALAVDSTILGLLGIGLGAFMFDELVRLGVYGRLFGFFIALIYFGTLNSWVGHGQTAGKWVMRVRVVGRDGTPLSVPRAMGRSMILEIPFFLNGAAIGSAAAFTGFDYLTSLLVIGGLAAIVYLYVFNRRTRQSLHDLAAGSYVVRADHTGAARFSRIWNVHLIVVAVLFAASLCVPFAASRLAQTPFFADMLPAYGALSKLPHVQAASLESKFLRTTSGHGSDYIVARLQLDNAMLGDEIFAERAARMVLAKYPKAAAKDAIHVELVHGYDIGIASNWKTHTHIYNLPERSSKSP